VRNEVIAKLRSHAPSLKQRGVLHLALIGSLARDEARPDSDVDVLVDIDRGSRFSLVDHAGLRRLVCDLLECDTDVLLRDALDPPILARIERDAVKVF
jgi:predicted nucleotidyltransferase